MTSMTFKDLYQQLVYIEDEKTLNVMKMGYQVKASGDETGILAYGYINKEGLLCFNVFSLVKLKGEEIVSFNDEPMLNKINHVVKREDVNNCKALSMELDPDILLRYLDRSIEINKENHISEDLDLLRSLKELDDFRHPLYPDEVEAFIYRPSDNQTQNIWAKAKSVGQGCVLAELVTPVPKDFLYAVGDNLSLKLYDIQGRLELVNIIEQ